TDARQGFEEVQLGSDLKGFFEVNFEGFDLLLDQVQLNPELFCGEASMKRELRQESQEGRALSGAEKITDVRSRQSILRQRGMDTVFEAGAIMSQDHPGAGEFPAIAQISRRDPDGGEGSGTLETVHAAGIQLISFVREPHHDLGFAGVSEL